MHKIAIAYQLAQEAPDDNLVRNPLLDMLHAVARSGSISGSAKLIGRSYRHVWGELKRWEDALGEPLIVWEQGQSARLTEFGDKLLWAERQAQARLAPQIAALRADLERAFAVAFDPDSHVLPLYASHDDALAQLREHASAERLHLDIRFTGSVDAIRALNQGRCVMAGFHVRPGSAPGSLAARAYKPLLKPGQHKIIGFARRRQGLLVARGNPLRVRSLADLPRLRFVNRALGTGTRVLLDELLAQHGIAAHHVDGYDGDEPSHAAVAQAVASGRADAGLAIETSAQAHRLDFIPLVEEHYHLVCLRAALATPAVGALLALLRDADWQARLAAISGYAPARCGEVLTMREVLPWWQFKARKAA